MSQVGGGELWGIGGGGGGGYEGYPANSTQRRPNYQTIFVIITSFYHPFHSPLSFLPLPSPLSLLLLPSPFPSPSLSPSFPSPLPFLPRSLSVWGSGRISSCEEKREGRWEVEERRRRLMKEKKRKRLMKRIKLIPCLLSYLYRVTCVVIEGLRRDR